MGDCGGSYMMLWRNGRRFRESFLEAKGLVPKAMGESKI